MKGIHMSSSKLDSIRGSLENGMWCETQIELYRKIEPFTRNVTAPIHRKAPSGKKYLDFP